MINLFWLTGVVFWTVVAAYVLPLLPALIVIGVGKVAQIIEDGLIELYDLEYRDVADMKDDGILLGIVIYYATYCRLWIAYRFLDQYADAVERLPHYRLIT